MLAHFGYFHFPYEMLRWKRCEKVKKPEKSKERMKKSQ